ncbi:unnamed protein product [Lactuca virosa]|uniref:Uncharacterized protein n=1 Tax=Lactuca virosa TaxID=75947 RepID=A0AAU9M2H1_9ASTR|nr:unnamed protein product [Lactuca virosa]
MSRSADLTLIEGEVDENEMFYIVVGGHDCKRIICGLGSYDMSTFLEKSSQMCTSPNTSSAKHHLETKIRRLEEIIEQRRMDLNDVKSMVNDMRNIINE